MLPRLHWADVLTVGHYLGVLVILTGVLMVIPLAVAGLFGEVKNVVAFVFGMGVCFTAGALLRLCRPHKLDRRCSLLLTGVGWIVVAFAASIPLYLSGDFSSYVNALFDAVSSLTTTGATLADDIDHLGYAQVMWRSVLTLFGGQTVIAIALYFGLFGEGGYALVAGSRSRGDERTPHADDIVRVIFKAMCCYLVIGTAIVFFIGLASGAPAVDALMTGFTLVANALSTGGFVPHTSGLIYYHSLGLEAVLAVFMLLGAINFGIYSFVLRGKLKVLLKNSELRTFAIWLLVLTVFVTMALTRDQVYTSLAGMFSMGAFSVISSATTSGIQTVYPEQYGISLSEGTLIILSVAILFGACSHSTGGGIKVIRITVVLRWIVYSIMRYLMPENAHVRVKYEHFGPKSLTARDAMTAMTIMILYIAAAALGAMLFIAHGHDSVQSILESVAYVSNAGVTAGLTSPDMSLDLKVVAILLMWVGRLEFIAIFAAFASLIISIRPENLTQGKRERALRKLKSLTRGGLAWHRRRSQKAGSRGARGSRGRKRRGRRGALAIGGLLLAGTLAASGLGAPLASAVSASSGTPQVPASEIDSLNAMRGYRQMDISELLSATTRLDGKDVELTGEAIGHAMYADERHKWVNLKQGRSMIGVYLTNEQAAQIETYGSYTTTGDTVTVRGVYHLACHEHADELEVHANSVEPAVPGSERVHAWSKFLLIAGLVLIVIGVGISIVQYLVLKRSNLNILPRLWR